MNLGNNPGYSKALLQKRHRIILYRIFYARWWNAFANPDLANHLIKSMDALWEKMSLPEQIIAQRTLR